MTPDVIDIDGPCPTCAGIDSADCPECHGSGRRLQMVERSPDARRAAAGEFLRTAQPLLLQIDGEPEAAAVRQAVAAVAAVVARLPGAGAPLRPAGARPAVPSAAPPTPLQAAIAQFAEALIRQMREVAPRSNNGGAEGNQ